MCGIIGYVGRREATPILLGGLARLEYRGYDSAGIATLSTSSQMEIRRAVGKLNNLRAVVNETPLPLVCFTREHLDPGAFLAALHERQIAWMSEARIDGTPVLRACITNYRTTEANIQQIVLEMNQLFQQGAGALQPEPHLQ